MTTERIMEPFVCTTLEHRVLKHEVVEKKWTVAELRETFPEGDGSIVDGLLTHIESLTRSLTAMEARALRAEDACEKDGNARAEAAGMQMEIDELRSSLIAGEKLREMALIWSTYQDDDSKKDQATDPQLRQQAENAERALLEALI